MTKREKIFYDKWNWVEMDVVNCPSPEKCACAQLLSQAINPYDYPQCNDIEDMYLERDEAVIAMHMNMVEQEAEQAGVML